MELIKKVSGPEGLKLQKHLEVSTATPTCPHAPPRPHPLKTRPYISESKENTKSRPWYKMARPWGLHPWVPRLWVQHPNQPKKLMKSKTSMNSQKYQTKKETNESVLFLLYVIIWPITNVLILGQNSLRPGILPQEICNAKSF